MFEKECVPYAPTLIESMRSIGYSFPSAIADLLDNSVSVHAKHIDILTNPSSDPFLVILDDGDGMTKEKLYEAMRYGSSNPLAERATDDLGRFGLGLKAASLSQCRRLVVVSKCNNEINACAWDLDYVIQKGVWALQCFDEKELVNYPFIDRLRASQQGTYIYLSNFDRIREGTNDLSRTFAQCLDDMGKHLSLVFHRFLEEGLSIRVNDLLLEAKDPFLKNHRATQKKRESSFRIYGEKIVLQPYILPHASKLSQEDLDKVGGKENLKNEQGFYIYRQKRLIIWGTWFRLERKDELSKLARVMVDIPNSLDSMWSIDIKKSTAILPDIIKKNMFNAVYESVLSIDILEKIEVSPKNEQFNTATIVKFIKDYRGNELKTWDISFATGTSTQPMDLGGGISYRHPVRKFSLENNGKIFKMSGSKRRLGTSSDATYGLEDSEVKAIKTRLNKQNPAQKDYFVNIKRNPLLTIYVVELGDGVTTSTSDGIQEADSHKGKIVVGFGMGIPSLSDSETKYARYVLNKVAIQQIFEGESGSDDENDSESED